jgi:hypothetical protein
MMHQGHYGNANWNQNWNQQAGPNPMQPVAGNAASWGSYGGNMQGVQQWGYSLFLLNIFTENNLIQLIVYL